MRMLKYRHTFRSESEFVPWMFTLARNAATDLYRARPKELPQQPDAPEPQADLPHPIAGLERAEQEGRLRRALARLIPPSARSCCWRASRSSSTTASPSSSASRRGR